jgi:hypothetical protein
LCLLSRDLLRRFIPGFINMRACAASDLNSARVSADRPPCFQAFILVFTCPVCPAYLKWER